MPPYKTVSKAWLVSPEKRLWAVLFDDRKLREEITEMIKDGAKINAIKALKLYAEENFLGCSLREIKNVIDKYNYRYIITTKIERLRERIEEWCSENGYKKMDNQKEIKDKSGQYTYKYSDWEYIDDAYGNMINDGDWLPHPKELRKYNKLWRKYE